MASVYVLSFVCYGIGCFGLDGRTETLTLPSQESCALVKEALEKNQTAEHIVIANCGDRAVPSFDLYSK